jgi:hypothetical protein
MFNHFKDYLLYLIIFLLPWQTRWIISEGFINKGSWEYGTFSLYAIDILIILAFAAFIFSQKELVIFIKKPIHRLFLLVFTLYSLCIIPLSLSPFLSFYKFGIWIAGIILIYLISKLPFRKASLAFISGAMFSGLLGIWQFLSQNSFASKWLGLGIHDSETPGTSVVEAMAPDGIIERWLRAYGSLDHPNMFGGVMAITLIFASWLWLFRKDAKNRFEGSILIISIAILTAATIVSFSRTAWLAAGIGLLITLIYYFYNKNKHWVDVCAWLAAIGIVTFLITNQYSYLFTPRISGDTRLEQISINERLDGIETSKTLFYKKPIFGFGPGSYTVAMQEINAKKPSWFYQPVHNSLALLVVEIGLVGVILLLLTIVSFLVYIFKQSSNEHRWLLVALILSLIVIAALDHWLVSLHFGIVFCATLLGLLASRQHTKVLTE